MTEYDNFSRIDCLVVGAGPAGLCCAAQAARYGASVLVLDENKLPGGQLFKQIHKFFGSGEHRAGERGFQIGESLLNEVIALGVQVELNTLVWAVEGDEVSIKRDHQIRRVKAACIVFALGAREKALSFPGSTLPGVMTAGAVQTLMHINRVRPGNRALVVGTGNVGLIVAYQLLQGGVDVAALVDVGQKVGGYAVHAEKIRRMGIPIYNSYCIESVSGKESVETARISSMENKKEFMNLDVDLICLSVGLSPRVELLKQAGVSLKWIPPLKEYHPIHNKEMQVSPSVWVAGDLSSIEEASTAMEEGTIAGLSVAKNLFPEREIEIAPELSKAQERLDLLRSGPFMEKTREGKEYIYSIYKSREQVKDEALI